MKLENKVAIVTGASRGMGKAIALAFAKEGVNLTIVGRNSDDLEQVSELVQQYGRQSYVSVCDVRDEQAVHRTVEETLERFGKIDILVNNAGVGLFKPVRETSLQEWKDIIDINLTGTFLFSRAVLDAMVVRGQGQIINISSDVGRRTIAKAGAYVASKFGVHAFSEVLAKEVRKLGIKVGVIAPGMTDTCFNNSEQGTVEKEGWLLVEDIAAAAVYMASAERHALIDEIIIHPIIQDY